MPHTPEQVFHRLTEGVSRLVAGDRSQLDAHRLGMSVAEQVGHAAYARLHRS